MRCHARDQVLLLLRSRTSSSRHERIVVVQPFLETIGIAQRRWMHAVSHGNGSSTYHHVHGMSLLLLLITTTTNESLRKVRQSLPIARVRAGSQQVVRRQTRRAIGRDAIVLVQAAFVVVVVDVVVLILLLLL